MAKGNPVNQVLNPLGFGVRSWGWVMRCLGFAGLLWGGSGVAWGEVPNGRWAALAAYGGAGIRYTTPRLINMEGRVLFGDGMAGSLRGAMEWDHEGWKVRPLAGLEASVFAPIHGNGQHGQSLAMFMGGEVRLTRRLTFQMDIGPALFHVWESQSKKAEGWDYQNVLNISLNYYFGKTVRPASAGRRP